MADVVYWPGATDRIYTYSVCAWPTSFNVQKPANYILCRLFAGQWQAIYIGETEDISEEFERHHAVSCIEGKKPTHIHAHFNDRGEDDRLLEKRDLIENYEPPCNQTPKK